MPVFHLSQQRCSQQKSYAGSYPISSYPSGNSYVGLSVTQQRSPQQQLIRRSFSYPNSSYSSSNSYASNHPNGSYPSCNSYGGLSVTPQSCNSCACLSVTPNSNYPSINSYFGMQLPPKAATRTPAVAQRTQLQFTYRQSPEQ